MVGRGFVNAGQLCIGSPLQDANGMILEVEQIYKEYLEEDEEVTVYNFQVEDWHTYHVGEMEVLVHNAGPGYESGKTTVDDLLKGLDETTNGKGVARNFESTGGYDQTLKDFDALNPSNVKDIQTKYGPGKVGTLSDGTKVVARQGSTTGGPTLEIKVSNSKVYKIRY